ncbi:bifunctional UDP-N-acetylglucosamine diphosphorylase/glucosamine-1-phosphate N-acetyltransferase GlmU [Acholeplasma sp. OttesenSCG-928-E16]|nr:bifunctional UDP-N-acetylglucosamine diphosphorylase/glucosamine-1-phosphate N-acetyltransferase GlmU [Acholeplasma sp. OttesenSCG-928-E16]
MKTYALLLAAGKGTRMRTDMPKCAYPILKKPMIEYSIERLENSLVDEICVVVGHKREVLMDLLGDRVQYVVQEEQLGTGHAVLCAEDLLKNKPGKTIILPGDMPLIETKLINKILNAHDDMGNDLTLVSTLYDNPKGYGRISRDKYGNVCSIVEDADLTDTQKQIKEVNTGVYVINNDILFDCLKEIKINEKKGEYYLTDIVSVMKRRFKIGLFLVRNSILMMGINDLYQISIAEKHLRVEINKWHMLNGVSIINPETVTIGHDVEIHPGAVINPNTTITGNSVIEADTIIGPNTEIHESTIKKNAQVKHSLVYDSEVGEFSTVGPFAHLRNHAVIGDHNRIGNFVEVKNSKIGSKTKASHLSYIGDAEVGDRVNFGCGSVTVNYDGVNKHKTIIGSDVFIGCNVNMVAPINISDNVFIAAGSTVTEDIPAGALTIARSRQINKDDYAKNLVKPQIDEKKAL